MKHRQVTLKAPYEQHPKSTWLQLIDIFPRKTRKGPGRNPLMGYINITFLRGFTTISQPKTVDPLKKCGNKRMSLENPIMMVRHRHEHWESYICKGLNLELVGLFFHSRPNITLPCGRTQLGYAWCLRHPKTMKHQIIMPVRPSQHGRYLTSPLDLHQDCMATGTRAHQRSMRSLLVCCWKSRCGCFTHHLWWLTPPYFSGSNYIIAG